MPHELKPDQIAALVRAFGEAARRCRAGRLDGIEFFKVPRGVHRAILDDTHAGRTI